MELEQETVPLLIGGYTIVTALVVGAIIYLMIRKRNWKNTWFILQLIFQSISAVTWLSLINDSRTANVIPSIENSITVAVSAFFWALGMGCMLIGIVMVSKTK